MRLVTSTLNPRSFLSRRHPCHRERDTSPPWHTAVQVQKRQFLYNLDRQTDRDKERKRERGFKKFTEKRVVANAKKPKLPRHRTKMLVQLTLTKDLF